MPTKDTTSVIPTVFSALIDLQEKSDAVRLKLQSLSDEHLKALFVGLEGASVVAWQLQADIIAELQKRSTYGSNAVAEIAKFLGFPERRAWELAQIENEILSKKPELRDLPLDKTHYLIALRGKRHGKDPVELLEYAVDHSLSTHALRSYVTDERDSAACRTLYYSMIEVALGFPVPDDMIQIQYLSPTARIVSIKDEKLLELKEFTNNKKKNVPHAD